MPMLPVQVCPQCQWVGTYRQTVRRFEEGQEATVACPRCSAYVECVPLELLEEEVEDLLKGCGRGA